MLKKSAYSQKFIESALTQPMKSGLIRSVARIAQSVEQGIENPRVLGSIPSPGTIFPFGNGVTVSLARSLEVRSPTLG